ncbi:Structural maintenance of chromosomes protein 6 [Choanephora cucurbitarum]|uniref:Structural maintenance of chromosomes protein 6 n=1 Tax=Choanephora cucurbitarum TaxID=101091 RepID=A0A1C7N1S2_9FUNG|nr:Structural maintenance of chromosomes protein 6 [Choanephora cucurbitarum]
MPTPLKRRSSTVQNFDNLPEDSSARNQKRLKKATSFNDNFDNGDDRPDQDEEDHSDEFQEDEDEDEDEEDADNMDEEGGQPRSSSKRTLNLNEIDFNNMTINEAGTIARVEVVNFMCHKYLKIDFGPKINFVVGYNGSGKSAILTAITLALGANASSTNRGKNLSSFIKEGQSAANITIVLTNRGENAYKPDIYPDYIIVERRINKEGISPYKLKNSSNRVVSTKKEELIAILDYMNILVNNPLTVLTQDMARKFLSDSTPEDKYKLFMHGTQLTSLKNDFETIRESLEVAKAMLERKKQAMPALQLKAQEAQKRYKEIEQSQHIEQNIDVLNNELVWSQIIQKEKEAEKLNRETNQAKHTLDQIKEAYEVQKEKVNVCQQKIVQIQEEWDIFKEQPDPHEQEKNELNDKKLEIELKNREFKLDLTEINNSIKEVKSSRQKHQESLQAETAKLEASSQIKRNEIAAEIEKLREAVNHKKGKEKQFKIEHDSIQEEINLAKEGYSNFNHQMADIRGQRNRLEKQIRTLEDQRGNQLTAYGRRMPEVLAAIRAETRWEKRRPVGPLGSKLSVEKQQFSEVLETILNKSLNAFVVESFADKNLLSRILSRFDMKYVPIIVSDYDLFEYAHGEPEPEYLTVLRAIKFEDEWVKRQLINSNKIEKILLMEDRKKADNIMLNKPRNIDLCFTSGGYKVGGKAGMRTEAIDKYRGPPRLQNDLDGVIVKLRREIAEKIKEYEQVELQARETKVRLMDLEKRAKECKRSEFGLDREIKNLERIISEKEDTMKEDDPVDLNIYQEDIKACEARIKSLVQQFQSIKEQQVENHKQLPDIIKRLQMLNADTLRREEQSNEYRSKITKLNEIKTQLQGELGQLDNKLQNMKLRYEGRKSSYAECSQLVNDWIQQAQEEYPDRVDTDRSPHEIEKEIKHLEGQARNLENQRGISTEQLQRETDAIVTQWQEAQEIVNGMTKLSRSLNKMLIERINKWEMFRNYIALAAKHYFSYYLHMRGDEGTLRFNHQTKRLDIRVSTGDQYSKGSRQKDSRSLSGGEKSFSQISLLLSLWQSISSPVICLDEFDVFMDAVNRKQTMSMIMNAASDNSSQYILITPQDASNMEPGPYVTVHRMRDPERG